jgi:tetratricopeptide (TPR) repeat protein
MRRRDFARAATLLEQGLTLEADRAAFLVKLAEARIALQQLDAAQTALTEAIETRPDQAMAHYNLALVHEARGNVPDAIAEYEAEIKVSPKLHQPEFNLAKLLVGSGRGQDALAHFRAAVDKEPGFGTGYLYLAKALLDAGDLPAAERAALRGLTLDPDPAIRPLGHFVLADVYGGMGRDADAKRQVELGRRAQRQGTR